MDIGTDKTGGGTDKLSLLHLITNLNAGLCRRTDMLLQGNITDRGNTQVRKPDSLCDILIFSRMNTATKGRKHYYASLVE